MTLATIRYPSHWLTQARDVLMDTVELARESKGDTMTLLSFLQDISTNPKILACWNRNKEATMTAAGLSESDKEALRSGDPAQIRAALGDARDIKIMLISLLSFPLK